MNPNQREIEGEVNSEHQPKSKEAAICSLKPQQNINKMKGAIPKDPNRSTSSNAANRDQLVSSQESEVVQNVPVCRGRISKNSSFKHNNVIPQDQKPSIIPQNQEVSVIPQNQEAFPISQDQEASVPQDKGASHNASYQSSTTLDKASKTKKPSIHHQFWNCDILSLKELKCIRKENVKYGKYLHTNCHSCESYYSISNPPYLQQCGISVCSACNKKGKIRCDSCNSNCDQKSTSQNIDLINNSHFLLPAFKHLNLLKTVDKFLDPYTCDETLCGLEQFENKIVNLKGEIQNALKALESNLLDFEENFSFVKKHLKNLIALRVRIESMNPSLVLNWREMSNFNILMEFSCYVDNALYCLLKTIQTSDIQIGLRVKDFSASGLNVDSNLPKFFFFALLEKYGKRQYYEFDLALHAGYVSTHKISVKPKNENILVIDYGSLRREREACGIFFKILNEVYGTCLIEIMFCDQINGALKEQLVLLCSGEEGPCYTVGILVVEENDLFILYAGEGLGCGLIQSIPDDVGNFVVPKVFDVSVTREFGCEACLRITRIVNNEPANIIGRVVSESVSNIQVGKWIIVNSGWIIPLVN